MLDDRLLDELNGKVHQIVSYLAGQHGSSIMIACTGAPGNPIEVLNHQQVCKDFARELKMWADEESFDNHQLQTLLEVWPATNKKIAAALFAARFWQTKWDTL